MYLISLYAKYDTWINTDVPIYQTCMIRDATPNFFAPFQAMTELSNSSHSESKTSNWPGGDQACPLGNYYYCQLSSYSWYYKSNYY